MSKVLQSFGRNVARKIVWVAVIASAFMLTYEVPAPEQRDPAMGSPQAVLAEHAADCWTGEQPDDVESPGAVIWQHPDGRTVYSTTLVGPALDTLFADGDLPGRPIAFCR